MQRFYCDDCHCYRAGIVQRGFPFWLNMILIFATIGLYLPFALYSTLRGRAIMCPHCGWLKRPQGIPALGLGVRLVTFLLIAFVATGIGYLSHNAPPVSLLPHGSPATLEHPNGGY
jgi:hypothetical protein